MNPHIDPHMDALEVRRVQNGWTLSAGYGIRRDMMGATHVARTPKELADLVQAWASQQGDLPAQGATA